MAELIMSEIMQATGGKLLVGEETLPIKAISIDSRTARSGDLFFAIRGPNFDGHDFVLDAFRKGACGAVISERKESFAVAPGRALVQVSDTTRALQDLARFVRAKWRGKLIAVTGSTGKTTTKDFIARILEGKFHTYKSTGNLNNLYGVPLVLSGLDASHEVAVLELGMSRKGEISELCAIAKPDIGVYTNIAPVHLEFFSSVDEIAEAKAELQASLDQQSALVYNAEDPLIRKIVARFGGKKISYGLTQGDVRALNVTPAGQDKTKFQIVSRGEVAEAEIAVLGTHNVLNALAAVAVALHFKMSLEQIVEQLQDVRPTPMRGELLHFEGGFSVIDDSYNSNPVALKAMVRMLTEMSGYKRKIVVAGEMLELGSQSKELHMDCGRFIARSYVDLLICIKGEAKSIGEGAILNKLDESAVSFFPESESAAQFLAQVVRSGDLILVKGSRGVQTERVIALLKEKFRLR